NQFVSLHVGTPTHSGEDQVVSTTRNLRIIHESRATPTPYEDSLCTPQITTCAKDFTSSVVSHRLRNARTSVLVRFLPTPHRGPWAEPPSTTDRSPNGIPRRR